MFGLGMGEIIVILIVALLFLGPEKLPDAAKQIGRAMREIRKHTDSLKETIDQDEELGGTIKELKSVLRGDELSPRIAPKAKPRPDEIMAPVAKGELEPPKPAAEGMPAPTPAAPGATTVTAPAVAAGETKPAEPKNG